MGVRASAFAIVILVIVLQAVACRQNDGLMPEPDGDIPDRLNDLSRDLLSVAARVPQARQEFADDLRVFGDDTAGEQAIGAFADRVAVAVEGAALTEQSARQLAHALWVAVDGTDMSERQIETAQNDLRGQLATAGVAPERSEAIAAEVVNVQAVVNTRERQWYELF
jgi:hypothetical protein